MNVKLSPNATKTHLMVGVALIFLSLGMMLACLFMAPKLLTFLIFFFGVWGGVETGRYLESWLGKQSIRETRQG